jgi:predicted AlkP superfamily phosphohydrolase/phosphomutase
MLYLLSDDPADEKAVSDGLESLHAPDGTDLDVSVYKPSDRYNGHKTELAPDLMFTIEDYACAIDPRPGTGEIFTSGPPSAARSGGHREEGIYVVAGPDAAESEGEERELLDIAPTVLALQDVPVPQEMDGRPMVDVFPTIQPESSDSRPSLNELVEVSGDGNNTDTESVEKRLDDLGYI